MKRSRFSEEQIAGSLKEHQAGATAADLCRKHGISDAAFYKRRSEYGGMEVSDAKNLKALEAKNTTTTVSGAHRSRLAIPKQRRGCVSTRPQSGTCNQQARNLS